ncbi:penicillin-binding protein 2 [Granulibacter bethesdensis]|uniref:penicillin-binding protein 2 n=1 Tax=Granulibacter bethesdensis TaxID=364410 RepID=UPI0003F1F4A2|nr:penicillin-binding protein 2 [Granulibacter bethesdensis]AHJ68714.1 Cell elongation specific D,D-transpeptidase [Granulibacter bethesdensis]
MKREIKRSGVFTRRALALAGLQVGVIGTLAAKLYQVQVVEGQRYALLAKTNHISERLIAPPRGHVLDRFGRPVATNRLHWLATLMTEETGDPDATLDNFHRLIPLDDHDRARIARDIRRHRRFIPVVIKDYLSWEEMALIEVNAPDLPGIAIDVGTTRVYPYGETLAHVVGYVAPPSEHDMGDDPILALPGVRIGRAGLEKFHDQPLRGRAGAMQLEVSAVGRVIRELDRQEGMPGSEVSLTIDAELQRSVIARLGDESASAVVLDAKNGEVLAMATNPSFDPSLFDHGVSQDQWKEWTRNRRAPLINKAVAGIYSPGSTFKMCVAIAGMESQLIGAGDRVFCPGYIDVGTARFHCWSKYGHGSVDMHQALKFSCDVYFYEVARRVGMDRIANVANRMGLGVELGIELPNAKRGLIPTRAWRAAKGHPWNVGDTIVAGIGQGYIQVTPLQLATYTARLATGRAVQPHLTRSIGGKAGSGTRPEDWPELDISQAALKAVRGGMFAVVNEQHGTAPLARLPLPVQMAGKTGSTQVRRVSRELRERGNFKSENLPWEFRPHALFVAYAPYDDPQYALAVVVEHGNAGAQAAAPVARDIMMDVLSRDPANKKPGQTIAEKG